MKNKKGFTLVELLAVIAILAILMLLIMPNILNLFQNGRRDAFINQIQTVWRTANQQFVSSSFSSNPLSAFCDKSQNLNNCKELDLGNTDVKYFVMLNSEANVSQIAVSDGYFCYVANSNPKINIKRNEVGNSDNKNVVCTANNAGEVTCSCQ